MAVPFRQESSEIARQVVVNGDSTSKGLREGDFTTAERSTSGDYVSNAIQWGSRSKKINQHSWVRKEQLPYHERKERPSHGRKLPQETRATDSNL